MNRIEELLSVGSEALGAQLKKMPKFLEQYALGPELLQMLQQKNGFYAFEHALHVFPSQSDITGVVTFEEWNSDTLWRNAYQGLADNLAFFAEDAFGDQFCLSDKVRGVLRFVAETAETQLVAGSIESWADRILTNYELETGWPFAHQWQAKHGRLAFGQRLQPKIPFIYGGEYDLENLWAGDAVKGMLFKGELAVKVKDLPEGTQVRLQVKEPEN
ncbi:MAG TPA: SMI1/KNR4 family protein [Candidatus Angelobacter sp.]|nr:SMI1/KNR4 family protein [Candidatus Angelobacter sp.]